jgi:hypothetical protein
MFTGSDASKISFQFQKCLHLDYDVLPRNPSIRRDARRLTLFKLQN